MPFSDILSHAREVSILKRAVKGGRVAHAYLFAGLDGIGKRRAAKELGRALNCEDVLEDGDSCGVCPSCKGFDYAGNLNYVEIIPEKGYLKIERIRELQRAARYKTDKETRLFVVEGADTMQKPAANAFLKTLEEPTPGTVIVLLSSRPSMLLPTIISRCQRINFSPLPTETIVALLLALDEEGTLTKEDAKSLASFSIGSVSRALDALTSGVHESLGGGQGAAGAILSSFLDNTMDTLQALKSAAELSKDSALFITLEILKSSIRDMVVIREGAPELVINKVERSGQGDIKLGFEELDRVFTAVDRAKRDMMPPRNANKQLAIEAMLMELGKRERVL